jgi:hypothetical protein
MFFPEIFSYVPDIRLNWTVRNVEPSGAMWENAWQHKTEHGTSRGEFDEFLLENDGV